VYTAKIASGDIPSIESAVVSIAKIVNTSAREDCIKQYVSSMSGLMLPTNDQQTLTTRHEQCAAEVEKMFKEKIMVIDTDEDLGKQLAVCSQILIHN